jgi:molybdate transport system substrate-binding protein
LVLLLGAVVSAGGCSGEGARDTSAIPLEVAVAANFAAVLTDVLPAFEEATGTPVRVSVGSTGSLYAQIHRGAPFDVFLAADADRPRRLEEEGLAAAGSRRAYALGRLVVYAPRMPRGWVVPGALRERGVRVAWANPRTAPYGVAALATLAAWGLTDLEGAVGESVGQAYQYVASGAADFGFVAGSQVRDASDGSFRVISPELHPPIVQEALILTRSRHPAARDFLAYLGSASVRARIGEGGYDLPEGATDGR